MAKILLVDDNVDNLEMEALLLVQAGHRVDVAERSDRALALYASQSYDLVIMDLAMPFMNGYELAEKIRATGDKVTPIAFLTADPRPSHERIEPLAPVCVWFKPITNEVLTGDVERILRGTVL